ncbi:adhesin [Bacillus bombysepticus]|uniref:adhesin n=1 Tax=Bacillus thuringiensis TaxID=1428 RepID=UPI001593835B|nr:adhesin [Bacillus thuringiensis]
MYPEVIKKMAFSKEHRDLLLKLYNKEIVVNMIDLYNRYINLLKRFARDRNGGDNLVDCLF